ncbi:lipoprotein [Agaribacter marinus]|uniref:Lipoprotein n=1 Tax=Virgibacillus salarius TaxID=447199 RepID=A0A941DYA4_9BACI|nr:lipoprotein [Virgibacillus salarius]NAZ09102.1 lipoprotein [Agaribacter marinus]
MKKLLVLLFIIIIVSGCNNTPFMYLKRTACLNSEMYK